MQNRKKVEFYNNNGIKLAGMLELPKDEVKSFALFAHCFTCSKNIAAASGIASALSKIGIAVLRFDFTGLGNSKGDFANTNFSSNMEDLVSAAEFLKKEYMAPRILIGHSLGGAAVLGAAKKIPECKAVVTVGAPSTSSHVKHHFAIKEKEIVEKGAATVTLGGRNFTIKKQFLDDIASHNLEDEISTLKKALLIFHSPIDDIVEISEASKIYKAAKHPKSFISLDNADHLLTNPSDSEYVATTIAAWADRYIKDNQK